MANKRILPPKVLIASTGRSGSGYIAQVLKECGINAGHEMYFRFPWQKKQQVDIDSSWLAVSKLDTYNGKVIHQVRDPLSVLTSLMNSYGENGSDYLKKRYFPFREKIIPYRTGDLMRDFMAMIVDMNNKIDSVAEYRYRVENVNGLVLKNILSALDVNYEDMVIEKALNAVSDHYNKHHSQKKLEWNDIPGSKEKDELIEQAIGYSYTVTS